MDIEKNAISLIEHIYDSALAPDKWPQMLEKFVASIGANSALLREVNYSSGAVGLFSTVGYDPALKQAYRDHFVHLDMFAPKLKQSSAGEIIHGDTAVPWAQQRTTEFFNDYMRPQGARYVLGATLARDSQHHLLFGIQRSARQGDFTDKDLQLIYAVAPHISRAAQIHRQLYQVTNQKQWVLAALDLLKTGVILLDEKGYPQFANKAAERIMSANNCVIADDGLLLNNMANTLRIHRLITDAAGCASGFAFPPGGKLNLHLNGQHFCLQVIPLMRGLSEQPWRWGLSTSCVAIFISTSSSSQLQHQNALVQYGLTPAEAKLAVLLMKGMDLSAAATHLSISVQTIRSQLKSIFAKTNVNRQAELVALLLSNLLLDCTADVDELPKGV